MKKVKTKAPEKLRKGIPPATGHLLQLNPTFGDTEQRVYKHRPEVIRWT